MRWVAGGIWSGRAGNGWQCRRSGIEVGFVVWMESVFSHGDVGDISGLGLDFCGKPGDPGGTEGVPYEHEDAKEGDTPPCASKSEP